MTDKRDFQEWDGDFRDFLSVGRETPPSRLTEQVSAWIESDLNPSPWKVFLKLTGIVAFTGALSLALCPQFGIGFVRHSGLLHFFMQFGPHFCSFACGTFFTGLGIVAATLLLRLEEVRVLRSNKFVLISALSALFLSFFVCLGAEAFSLFALSWLVGASLGGILALETVYYVYRAAVRRVSPSS